MKNLPKIFLAINLIILNTAVGFLFYDLKFSEKSDDYNSQNLINLVNPNENLSFDNCGDECKKYINSVISEKISINENAISETPTPKPTLRADKVRRTYYVPIPGSGNTLERDWVNLSGTDFYLSKNDYPGIIEVYFEGNIKLVNANGKAFVRLYDKTHSIGVNGSQIESSSQTSTFVSSGKLSFWEGYNHYIVQVKTLSADTAVFESGRLKIITEE